MSESYRIAVVGARRERQGTGEYVAREFANCGCDVRAIIGTTPATVKAARHNLREQYGINCDGYLSLPALLAAEAIDVIAICSPPEAHLFDLELAVEAGCHVFCEKPMWWSSELAATPIVRAEIRQRATELIDRCARQGRFFALNTQWPFTLVAFRELHPHAYGRDRPVHSYSMWLCPGSTGSRMVVDSGPHLLSMLQALVGTGTIKDIRAEFRDGSALGERAELLISFNYVHGENEICVTFRLTHCRKTPRPAGYSINGFSAERHIEPQNYMISFENEGKRVSIRDPLAVCVKHFVEAMQAGRQPDRTCVVDGMTQLHELVAATQSREQ